MFQVNFGIFYVFTWKPTIGGIKWRYFSIPKKNFLTYTEEKLSMIASKLIEERLVEKLRTRSAISGDASA